MDGLTDLQKIIIQKAKDKNADPAIILAFCEIESSFDPLACRYEPIFRWTKPNAQRPRNSTIETEIQHQKTSWGLMQVMGIVARELGHKGWMTELITPAIGLHYGILHYQNKLKRYENDINKIDKAISAYNAGSYTETNISYVHKIKKAAEKWGRVL